MTLVFLLKFLLKIKEKKFNDLDGIDRRLFRKKIINNKTAKQFRSDGANNLLL
jgi:hypothetical protein